MNPCPICAGGETIVLMDEYCVPIDECPWTYDYTQESYIVEAYGHYQNGHLIYPLNETPEWLSQGITLLNRIENERREVEMNKARRGS